MVTSHHFLTFFSLTVALICSTSFSFSPQRVLPSQYQRQPPFCVLCERRRLGSFALFAKKKKNKRKKSSSEKKSGFEWASSFTLKPFEAKPTRDLAASAVASFVGRTGKPLSDDLKGSTDVPKALWNAPIACVIVEPSSSEVIEEADVPSGRRVVVKYANVAALETVGLQPAEFGRLLTSADGRPPSGGDGPVVEINLPTAMNGDKKYESGYSKRILQRKNDSNDDDAVTIINAQRWTIERSSLVGGKFLSQTLGVAYAWKEWILGNNIVCSPGGGRREHIDVEGLEEAIETKAAAIRALKEGQGKGNKDPEVMEAVQELLRLKSLLADTQ